MENNTANKYDNSKIKGLNQQVYVMGLTGFQILFLMLSTIILLFVLTTFIDSLFAFAITGMYLFSSMYVGNTIAQKQKEGEKNYISSSLHFSDVGKYWEDKRGINQELGNKNIP